MKKLFLFLTLAGIFVSCEKKYSETVTYQVNEPVYMSSEAFRSSVVVTDEEHAVTGGGKICFYNGYLYISEPGTGIHIIDNRNPSNPHAVGFINLLGNADLAIRNNLLYADAYTNLAWFDISNPVQPQVKGILENVFVGALPLIDNGFGYDYNEVNSPEARSKGVIVGWKLTQRTREVVHNRDDEMIFENMRGPSYVADKSTNMASGVNGSMSRFGLYKDYLYVVMGSQMGIFDLKTDTPNQVFFNYLPYMSEVETIFSYGDKMFLGMPSGMAIYSVKDPLDPTFCSFIVHAYGCDPVVVENNLAYVTVRSGNFCGQTINELFIVDVSDEYNPKMLVSYSMTHPKGLGIDKGMLFICDDGLKIFKADDPQTIIANQLAHYKGMDGFDVIPYNNILMMIAEDGLYQYDYSDLKNIKELGALLFQRKE
jgi:hypothetical protein